MNSLMKAFGMLVSLSSAAASLMGSDSEIMHRAVIFKEVDGVQLSAHVFHDPSTMEAGPRPALACFHGGGWAYGNPNEFFELCQRYARQGLVAVSFQYRLCINEDGTYPHPHITPIECVKDVRSSMRWLRENAPEFGIDPTRIVAMGQSAGGQLALSTVLMDGIDEYSDDQEVDPRPNAVVLYSSCVNTIEPWLDNLMGERRERIWDISPFHQLEPDMPPVLQFHSRDDSMVPMYTVDFFRARMEELGNHHEMVVLDGRGHYLGGDREGKYAGYVDEEILSRTDAFLVNLGFWPEKRDSLSGD